MNKKFKPQITLFHCINVFPEGASLPFTARESFDLKTVKLPCSGLIRDIVLMKAFESGSDGVIVMVCPEKQCRYVKGNLRAKKRVDWVKNLLDEIGISGRRLTIHNVIRKDKKAAVRIIQKAIEDLQELGPNPAA